MTIIKVYTVFILLILSGCFFQNEGNRESNLEKVEYFEEPSDTTFTSIVENTTYHLPDANTLLTYKIKSECDRDRVKTYTDTTCYEILKFETGIALIPESDYGSCIHFMGDSSYFENQDWEHIGGYGSKANNCLRDHVDSLERWDTFSRVYRYSEGQVEFTMNRSDYCRAESDVSFSLDFDYNTKDHEIKALDCRTIEITNPDQVVYQVKYTYKQGDWIYKDYIFNEKTCTKKFQDFRASSESCKIAYREFKRNPQDEEYSSTHAYSYYYQGISKDFNECIESLNLNYPVINFDL